jgi:AcrR family transcriptional regulator
MPKVTAKSQNQPRRQPSQERGQLRVDEILRTAEALFALHGVERVSTNQIAEEAGISIGSIYQFFANKDAILIALAARYQDTLARLVLSIAADIPSMSVAALVERMIDVGSAFTLEHRAFGQLLLRAQPGTALGQAEQQLRTGMLQLIESVIAQRTPQLAVEKRQLYATMAQLLQRATLERVIAEQQAGNHALVTKLIAESKRMQIAYFEKLFAEFGIPNS